MTQKHRDAFASSDESGNWTQTIGVQSVYKQNVFATWAWVFPSNARVTADAIVKDADQQLKSREACWQNVLL